MQCMQKTKICFIIFGGSVKGIVVYLYNYTRIKGYRYAIEL